MTDEGGEPSGHLAWARTLLRLEIVRFGAVGTFNTLFGLGLFWLLQATLGRVVHYVIVAVVANVVPTFVAYVLQRAFVFRAEGRFWRDLVRFSGVYVVAMLLNVVALPVLVEFAHLSPNIAQVFVVGGVALGTYLVHRSFTFRHSRTSGGVASRRVEGAADGVAEGTGGRAAEGSRAPGSGGGSLLL